MQDREDRIRIADIRIGYVGVYELLKENFDDEKLDFITKHIINLIS